MAEKPHLHDFKPTGSPFVFRCECGEASYFGKISDKVCPYCGALDNGTCAYPSEGKPGCLTQPS